MKKLLFVALAAFGLWACSSQEEPQVPVLNESMPQTELTYARTPEEAVNFTLDAYNHFYGESRSIPEIKNVRTFKSQQGRSSESSDTSFYVVNLENNGGYAVIAANPYIEPVLAITENGNIESLDDIENPGAAMFFNQLYSFLLPPNVKPAFGDSLTDLRWNYDIGYGPINDTGENEYRTETYVDDNKSELRAPFNWGQRYPEGIYCPNGLSGCTNTATALVFSYFAYPTEFDDLHGNVVAIDWDSVRAHKQSTNENQMDGCATQAGHTSLARLCRALGVRNNSTYSMNPWGTGTALEPAYNTVTAYYGTVSDIYNGMPYAYRDMQMGVIMVFAFAIDKYGSKCGHTFVIDGFNHQEIITETLMRKPLQRDWTTISKSSRWADYNHVNWGWNGSDNGYYSIGCLDPNNAYYYDGRKEDSAYTNFNIETKYFVVIHPFALIGNPISR